MFLSVDQPLFQNSLFENQYLIYFDKNTFSEITSNQAYLVKQLVSLVELEVYFDEETNVFLKKLIEFLKPTAIGSLSLSSKDITQAMNQVSNYFGAQTEELSDNQIHSKHYVHTKKISKRSQSLRNLFPNKQIIFLKEDSYAAHVLYTLAAFASLLYKQPRLINNLVFILLCSSKVAPQELEAVPEIVRQINQLYGTSDFVPVHFYHQEIDRDELLAFMNASHIGLCLNESAVQEFARFTNYSRKSVSIRDPSDISQLTELLQNALSDSVN